MQCHPCPPPSQMFVNIKKLSSTKMMKRKVKVIEDALNDTELLDSALRDILSRALGTVDILHGAIRIGAPNHILLRILDRFPTSFVDQADEDGRFPIHLACVYGASSEFISRCILANRSAVFARDNQGRTPIHLLCRNTWRGQWDIRTKASECFWGITAPYADDVAESNIFEILWLLYCCAPSTVAYEDYCGVGTVEEALENDLPPRFIRHLQKMVACINSNDAHQMRLIKKKTIDASTRYFTSMRSV